MMSKFVVPLLMLFLVYVPVSLAQALTDPTRPPHGIGETIQSEGLISYPQVRGLQSVIVSAEHCAAIIDGKTVVLGAKYGNEKLIEVNERGVVLQGEHGQRILTLFPTVGVKITVSSRDQQAVKCRVGQSRQIKGSAKQAGQKEKQ